VDILIIGAGIGGLTLGLMLHRRGIACRIYEAAPEIRPLGVGINILPHASKELGELGLEDVLTPVAVLTKEAAFFNRFGQLIYREPLGRDAGYEWPQYSIHRGDLQAVLRDAFCSRAGADRLQLGWKCVRAEDGGDGATAHFVDPATGAALPPQRGRAVIGCDGVNSALRKQLNPEEGEPRYSGVNMWRGVTRWPPMLSGATMVRAGWLNPGKMVIYPIRDRIDADGRQLINWLAEIETTHYLPKRDWARPGRIDDFIGPYRDWHFDWCDVPALIRAADAIYEYPMVDQDPLDRWTFGRLTLAGDAAHPMVPRGSNGAGQAILDARVLADELAARRDPAEALRVYEAARRPATSRVVLTNRTTPPDAILREVKLRSGDRPFERIEDVIGLDELRAMSEGYKKVAGYDQATLAGGRSGGG
jgi:2-polyprenyl-6-methoxyphenol hydroxylase-like FAD-dependent oxidoreductase